MTDTDIDEFGEKVYQDFMKRFQEQILKQMIENGDIVEIDGELVIRNSPDS